MNLKLWFYKLFNIIYVGATPGVPNWANGGNGTANSNCEGGISVTSDGITVCKPKVGGGNADNEINGILGILDEWDQIIRGFSLIICVISLALAGVQLAMSAGNQMKKQKAMERLKMSLIATAVLGSLNLIISILLGIAR